MTSQEANSIPLEDILSRYGYEPSRRYGGYDMYRSPFRCDSSPSFKVFRNENRWYDFGDSSHGRVVDLVMRIHNCSFPQAMKEIEGLGFSSGMIPQPRPVPVTVQKASGMTLLKIIPVENGHLLDYAASRGIDADIVREHCGALLLREESPREIRAGVRQRPRRFRTA